MRDEGWLEGRGEGRGGEAIVIHQIGLREEEGEGG